MAESESRLVFVDLEVAGGELTRPILQVAAIAVDSAFREVESFEAKLKFASELADRRSLTKRRYCEATWTAEARSATSVAREFAHFLRRHATLVAPASVGRCFRVAQLACHNAAFDGPFLRTWFERVGAFFPGHYRILCTMQRALWLFHEHPGLCPPLDYKLGTLCGYFGVPLPPAQAHTALADVRATAELYRRIMLLGTAESASFESPRPSAARRHRRVACVAGRPRKACRLRRKAKTQTCRSRRSAPQTPQT